MKELEKQMKTVQVAMETVKILNDLESRHILSVELLRLAKMTDISDERMLEIRKKYGLNSVVWIIAEREVQKEIEESTRVDEEEEK